MGRPTGARNKNKQALIKLLQEKYPGYEPVMEMAAAAMEVTRLAREAKDNADLWAQASNAHEKVANYVTPKLKAVELSGPEGEDLLVINVNQYGKRLEVNGVEPGDVEKGDAYSEQDTKEPEPYASKDGKYPRE